jgi:hypothetical protein
MASKIRVKEWINCGELDDTAKTQSQILENCANLLDAVCSPEILGPVLFKATNGKYYTITIEAVLGEASKSFIKETLAEKASDTEIVQTI